MKIIQALSELFYNFSKNKKGSMNTHTHSQRHPNDRKCLDTQACTQEQRPGNASNMSENARTVDRYSRDWVRGIGQIFSHSPQKETSLVDTLILDC